MAIQRTQLPSQEALQKVLKYEPETGKLFWIARPIEDFLIPRLGKFHNTKYAGKEAFTCNKNGYLIGAIAGIGYAAHRIIYKLVHGIDPDEIDHINGNRSDNRPCNLRSASKTDNARNACRRKDNSSGITGVCWHQATQKWIARINANGKDIHLGVFAMMSEAVAVRLLAEKKFGYHPNHGRH